MSKSSDSEPTEAVEHIRTKEPQAPFGADEPNPSVASDDTVDEQSSQDEPNTGIGGYGKRDPKTDMPAVPSAPETQDDPQSHDAAPDGGGKGPGAHE